MGAYSSKDGVDKVKETKVALGYPWYNGPDVDTFDLYQEILFYLGRLEERSFWFAEMQEKGRDIGQLNLPPLDMVGQDPAAEIRPEDGVFRFFQAQMKRLSLTGLAREIIVEMAQDAGADWLFMWDADMRFPYSTFLRLWRHQKPIVNALAFTSRDPAQPCLYTIRHGVDPVNGGEKMSSETVYDIPDKPLITDTDVGGEIAFGAGVLLVNMNVFKQIPRPWFHSTGCGEDWYFCCRAAQYGVPRYVDTSIMIDHKKHMPRWVNRSVFDHAYAADPDLYKRLRERPV